MGRMMWDWEIDTVQVLTVQGFGGRAEAEGQERIGRFLLWLPWVMCAELVGDVTTLGC